MFFKIKFLYLNKIKKMSWDLYECKEGEILIFTDKIINQIRNLKSSISNDSGYTPDGRMLQWNQADNSDIRESEFKQLVKYMQFICMIGIMSDEFKKKHNVEYHHEALLRRLYLDNDEDGYGNFVITTAFKRPFGNSYVERDIADEMEATYKIYGKKEYFPYLDDSKNELNYELVSSEYFKFLDILDAFIKDFQMDYFSFKKVARNLFSSVKINSFEWSKYLQPKFGQHRGHSYLGEWRITESELRDNKISKILDKIF